MTYRKLQIRNAVLVPAESWYFEFIATFADRRSFSTSRFDNVNSFGQLYFLFFFDALAAPRGWKEPDKLLEMQMHSWQLSNDKFYSEHFLAALLCTLTVVFFPLRSFEETTRAMFSLGALAVQPLLSFSPYCVTKKKKKVNKAWKAAAKPFSVKSSNSLRWRL
jgi:hypothetical protein